MYRQSIRNIVPEDNAELAAIIRGSLLDFNAAKPGTVYFDPTTDNLFKVFQTPRSAYFVALEEEQIAGGAGVYPTDGLPQDTCELVKFYLRSSSRGKGLGKLLMDHCFTKAKEHGYKKNLS